MSKGKLLKLGILGYFFLAPLFIFAQIPDLGRSFTLSVLPQNPGPNESVTFSVSAFEFSVDLASIVWSVDGKMVKSGVGQKSFSITSPSNGKSTTVSVIVTPKDGSHIEKSTVLSPADVDLIYEVIDGYAPPFYRGKVLPIKQSQIKVVAMPEVKTLGGGYARAKDFAYTWRKDGKNIPSQSGFGRNSMVFSNQILDQNNIVEVSATNGIKTVNSLLTLTPFNPEILFYEEFSIQGVQYQKALSFEKDLKKPRLTIVAEPYFLPTDFKTNKDTTWEWTINGSKIEGEKDNTLGINTLERTGEMSIGVTYNETKRLFRKTLGSMKITNQ